MNIAIEELKEYDIFKPEIALKYPWKSKDGPFNLTHFEELIAEISHAVVIFPESPGSFCETGYFAAKENIVRKTLLAISKKFEGHDSFISTGPLNLFNETSDFRPAQYVDYSGDFREVISRIKARKPERNRKAINVTKYKEMSFSEKMGMIQKIVKFLQIATIEDILFVMRAAFNSHISENEIRGLAAILRGSGYLLRDDKYGHLYANSYKADFLEVRSGSIGEETEILFQIANHIEGDADFSSLLIEIKHAD